MKKLLLIGWVLIATVGFCMNAGAAVIDFEPLAQQGDGMDAYYSTYTEDGFTISNYADGTLSKDLTVYGTGSAEYTGSTALFVDGYGDVDYRTVLTAAAGGTFSVSSINLCELSRYNTEAFDVTFTGLLGDGPSITTTFSLDGDYGFESFSFTDEFAALTSLSWELMATDYGYQIDTIDATATSPVPVPAAVWLLGSGLAGLVGMRRRAKTA